MPTRDLTFAIVGSGGDGVITVGDMMAQAGASEGLHVMKVEAYGPQIRGGESSCTVRLSADPIFAQGDQVEVLVVFNWADFGQFRGEIICGENEQAELKAVVTAVPDPKKGERLIVIHTALHQSPQQLCQALTEAGLPNIFVPSPDSFVEIDELPVLGSGKLDLKGIKRVALERFGEK